MCQSVGCINRPVAPVLSETRRMTVKVKISDDVTEDEREDESQNEVYDYGDHSDEEYIECERYGLS